jgi:hypothetical protein
MLQLPDQLMDYETNWLRHALTMVSRAQHLQGQQEQRAVELSLLSLAQAQATRLDCLRPDGLAPDDEQILSSLAQFDARSNIVAVADRPDLDYGKTFYTNFARFHSHRVQQVVEDLLTDDTMRAELGVQDDARLASALFAVDRMARQEGVRYRGFSGWTYSPAWDFIAEHHPQNDA